MSILNLDLDYEVSQTKKKRKGKLNIMKNSVLDVHDQKWKDYWKLWI
jgi:hypothetical protein